MWKWRLKGCPRCGGDISINQDHHGWYEECLQCGYTSELKNITELKQPPAEREKKPVGARNK